MCAPLFIITGANAIAAMPENAKIPAVASAAALFFLKIEWRAPEDCIITSTLPGPWMLDVSSSDRKPHRGGRKAEVGTTSQLSWHSARGAYRSRLRRSCRTASFHGNERGLTGPSESPNDKRRAHVLKPTFRVVILEHVHVWIFLKILVNFNWFGH